MIVSKQKHGGFTLVEISIVLIIIGLILGGILAGRDLIRATQVRAQVSQLQKLDTAVYTFRTKYNCLPGDCAQAVANGLGTSGGDGDDGDGSGRVEITEAAAIDGDELRYFWYHLTAAKLIPGSYPTDGFVPGVNSPPLAMPGMGIQGNSSGGIWFMSNELHPTGYRPITDYILTTSLVAASSSGVYLAPEAYALDSKMDDGNSVAGRITASPGLVATLSAFGAGDQETFIVPIGTGCLSGTAATGGYYLSVNLAPSASSLCNIMIKTKF